MSDLTQADYQIMAGVVNRHGRDEMAQAFLNIFERLETLEETAFRPPGGGPGIFARLKKIEDEIFPPAESEGQAAESPLEGEEVQAPQEGEVPSSTPPESEPATQTQEQS